MTELSVIIATRNDDAVLEHCLSSLYGVLMLSSICFEVLIVDDASTDGTVDLATKLSERYPELHLRVFQLSRTSPGFGAMVRYGIAHATGRFCVLVAPDGIDPVDLVPKMVAQLREGKQLVICSRYAEADDPAGVALRYRVYQRLYRRAIKICLGREIKDSTNGFRGFDRQFCQTIGLSSNRFSVCPEMTFKILLADGDIGYLSGQPRRPPGGASDKFTLQNEALGYALVLLRATLHRAGVPWF